MRQDLKVWPLEFSAIISGLKTFEIRSTADRTFSAGDTLKLREYDPDLSEYTGAWCEVRVTYVLAGGNFGLPADLCAMSIRIMWHRSPPLTAAEKAAIDAGC